MWRLAPWRRPTRRRHVAIAASLTAIAAVAIASLAWRAPPSSPSAVTVELGMPQPLSPPPPSDDTAAQTPVRDVRTDAAPGRAAAAFTVPAITPGAFAGFVPIAAVPLPPAPDRALVEERNGRQLPRIGEDGRQPWQVYARPFDKRDDRARIAIIVAGLGLSATATDAAIHYLPADVTLAFDAYGDNLPAWAAEARAAGHEILLTLPLQSPEFPFVDNGPQALAVTLRGEDMRQRLDYLLGLFPGYVGALSPGYSAVTQNRETAQLLLAALQRRGLLYVEAGAGAKATTLPVAGDLGAIRVAADLWLDEELSAVAIDQRLARLEALARSRFVAVGLTRPRPLAMQRLLAWAARLNPNEFVLAPVSAVAMAPLTR